MKVEAQRSFAATRETVWSVLNDLKAMAELMPGVESFDVRDDDRHWIAQVKIPLGLGGLRMKINFDKLGREPKYARLRAKGQGVGALMDMETQFHLDDVEAARTCAGRRT